MKDVNGIWLPDHEVHLVEHFSNSGPYGKWTYQANKLLEALKFVRGVSCAIDVGGHCGLWSKELVKMFDHVIAFEPVAEHRECYRLNVHGNYTLHPVSLGETFGTCSIHTTEGQSGDSWVDGEGDIPVRTLDSFEIEHVDFMKLDCEGYELFALKGGEDLIKRCKPVIIVEQKPGRGKKFGLHDTAAVTYLESLGYALKKVISGDYILA